MIALIRRGILSMTLLTSSCSILSLTASVFYMGKAPPTYTKKKSMLDNDGACFDGAKYQYKDLVI